MPNVIDRPMSFAQFRSFALEQDVNAARHMTRPQLEKTFNELLSLYDMLPPAARYAVDGALACAQQAATRGETFE